MREEVYDDGKLRKYLLGGLNEAEQHALEERLLTDDELFDLLHIAEDELVDDYLSGALSADEEDRFGGFFLSTPARRRNLSFAMALRRYVTIDAALPQPSRPTPQVVAPNSTLIGHRSPRWKRVFSAPYLKLAAAIVIMLAAGLGTWRVFFDGSEVDKGIAALARAYGN